LAEYDGCTQRITHFEALGRAALPGHPKEGKELAMIGKRNNPGRVNSIVSPEGRGCLRWPTLVGSDWAETIEHCPVMKDLSELITDHPFFRGMKPQHIDIVAQGAAEAMYAPGQIVFREREYANHFYLILEGRVGIEAKGEGSDAVRLETLGPGEALGWSWLFPPYTWHFEARAIELTRILVLDGAHLLVTCETDHEFGFEVMKRVSAVVIQRLQAARKILTRSSSLAGRT
jgi:CRP/FNR family transcriptional regulator, cyclic AMP receptor protein